MSSHPTSPDRDTVELSADEMQAIIDAHDPRNRRLERPLAWHLEVDSDDDEPAPQTLRAASPESE